MGSIAHLEVLLDQDYGRKLFNLFENAKKFGFGLVF